METTELDKLSHMWQTWRQEAHYLQAGQPATVELFFEDILRALGAKDNTIRRIIGRVPSLYQPKPRELAVTTYGKLSLRIWHLRDRLRALRLRFRRI